MNKKTKSRLNDLKNDYKEVAGFEFKHFYCPILFTDEKTRLCQAHIVNKALPDSDDSWTVQRADVDSFFGRHFEADFVLIREKGLHTPEQVLIDKRLARQLKPRFFENNQPVEFYYPNGEIPEHHSRIRIFSQDESTELALKRSPEEMDSSLHHDWEVRIEHNLNLAALVSLIKAAHLTLFHMLGYRHPLSAGGRFVGDSILGNFYKKCSQLKKEEVVKLAQPHFAEFANMVRPVLNRPHDIKGTISDNYLYVWMYMGKPWAILVFINIANNLHAIALPVFEDGEGAARFCQFLGKEEFITEARLAKWKGDSWEISTKWEFQKWPKSNYNPEA